MRATVEFLLRNIGAIIFLTIFLAILALVLLNIRFVLIVLGALLAFAIGFYIAVFFISFPFIAILAFYGGFRHPKSLITIRSGRALVAGSLLVIALEASLHGVSVNFVPGSPDIGPSALRGYSWLVILFLFVSYFRALYVEGHDEFKTPRRKAEFSAKFLLLSPGLLLVLLVFDILLPFMLSLSVLVSLRCEGFMTAQASTSWVLEQFEFVRTFVKDLSWQVVKLTSISEQDVVERMAELRQAVSKQYSKIAGWFSTSLTELERSTGFDLSKLNMFSNLRACPVEAP